MRLLTDGLVNHVGQNSLNRPINKNTHITGTLTMCDCHILEEVGHMLYYSFNCQRNAHTLDIGHETAQSKVDNPILCYDYNTIFKFT